MNHMFFQLQFWCDDVTLDPGSSDGLRSLGEPLTAGCFGPDLPHRGGAISSVIRIQRRPPLPLSIDANMATEE